MNSSTAVSPNDQPGAGESTGALLTFSRIKNEQNSLRPEFLRSLVEHFGIVTFIETATYRGDTAAMAAGMVREVHTIELAPELARKAKQRFATQPQVHVHIGDSARMLAKILTRQRGPALIWLDAHCGEDKPHSCDAPIQILNELRAVKQSGRKDAVILIDDLWMFDRRPLSAADSAPQQGFPSVNEVHAAVCEIASDYQFFTLGDVAIAFPPAANVNVSPLVLAMTISRLFDGTNLPAEEVIAAESLIAQTEGVEREVLAELSLAFAAKDNHSLGLHYRLWHGQTLLGETKFLEAKRRFQEIQRLGFDHWRMHWYVALACHGAGEIDCACKILDALIQVVPDFAAARELRRTLTPASISASHCDAVGRPQCQGVPAPNLEAELAGPDWLGWRQRLETIKIHVDSMALDKSGYNDDNPSTNGEYSLLSRLVCPGDVIFDVGANIGDWSQRLLATVEPSSLHSFEPCPATFAKLSNNLRATAAVLHNFALSDLAGDRILHQFTGKDEYCGMNTFFRRPVVEKRLNVETLPATVQTLTLDDFCSQNGIEFVDLLKIDTEGAELEVLRGATGMLTQHRIGLIQFEYGGCYLDAGITLKQVYHLLAGAGYDLFRILPEGLIHIGAWRDELEVNLYSNYLAVCNRTPADVPSKLTNPHSSHDGSLISEPPTAALIFSRYHWEKNLAHRNIGSGRMQQEVFKCLQGLGFKTVFAGQEDPAYPAPINQADIIVGLTPAFVKLPADNKSVRFLYTCNTHVAVRRARLLASAAKWNLPCEDLPDEAHFLEAYKKTDFFIVSENDEGIANFTTRGVDQKQICRYRNSIDPEVWQPAVTDKKRARFSFVFYGSPWVRKGLPALLKAWETWKVGKDVELHLVGMPTPVTERLFGGQTQGEHPAGVHLHLRSYKSQEPFLQELFCSCHVGVFPTLDDAQAAAIMEVAACGLPIVTTRESGHDFPHEFCAYVKHDDSESIAQGLDYWYQRQAEVATAGHKAREYILKNHSWSSFRDCFGRVVLDALTAQLDSANSRLPMERRDQIRALILRNQKLGLWHNPAFKPSAHTVGFLFSANQPEALTVTLRSFFQRCQDAERVNLKVIYRAANRTEALKYQSLTAEFPGAEFITEKHIRGDIVHLMRPYQYVLALNVGTVFAENFHLAGILQTLKDQPAVLELSLRCGANPATLCAPGQSVTPPVQRLITGGISPTSFLGGHSGWNLLLGICGSIYRVDDYLELLERAAPREPKFDSVPQAEAKGKPVNLAPRTGEVVVKLQGGLGNQMFQFAAGLALASRHGSRLKLDLSFLRNRSPQLNVVLRDYCLDLFQLPADCEIVSDAAELAKRLQTHIEHHYHFDPNFEKLGPNAYLDGYFQSPRFFKLVQDEVLRTFTSYATPLHGKQLELTETIKACPAVCLHVRRGDFISNPKSNSFQGVCDENYFQKAVETIRQRVPGAHFFIFSDDVEWCRTANLTNGAPFTIASQDSAAAGINADIQLMTACRHFILANSSFSWWTAFLGAAPDKIVIVPEPWFDDPKFNTVDLLPASWIRMPKNGASAPLVSVIIPCHNYAEYLPESVGSVWNQTYRNFEIILINVGSTDNSAAVAQRLAGETAQGVPFRVFHLDNVGPSAARNFGAAQARGKYLLPLDADDRIAPDYLAKTVALLETEAKLGLAYVDQIYFGEGEKLYRQPEYDFARLCRENYIGCCSLIRKTAFDDVGGYDSDNWCYYEDWELWIRLGTKGWFGKHLAEPLFYYRHHFGSSLMNFSGRLDPICKAFVYSRHPELYSAEILAAARQKLSEMPDGWHRRPPMRDIAQTRELLAQYPRNRHILYFLGCALAKQGQRAEAETVLGNLLDLYPDDQQAREAVKQITSSPETSRPATSAVAGANPSGDIVAIIAAYNEGDVIYQVLDDLIKNGIKVYFMDNASTDNTREEVSRLLGKGVIHIERFPKDAAASNRSEQQYVWRDILRRKTEIAKKLNAAWYIHADGDEFRESPWPGLTLAEAIRRVDALGFNALSFDLINFRPVDDHFVPGSDVREHMKYYEEAEFFNRTQIKAWKNTGQPVDLASSGGHQAEFAGRRIFPLPFLHRHYPIRGETHGRQKVLRERLPRFTAEERAAGWHVQYDCYAAGEAKFLKQPAELKPYDPLTARLELMTRALKDPQLASAITRASAGAAILLNQAVCGWMQEVTASKDSESAARTAEKEAIRTLALKAINADDFCKALKHFESEPAPKPAPPAVVSHQPVEATEVLLERAAAFFQASNWSEAGDIYRVLCRRLPNEITVWRGQIECSRQQNHTVLANLILAEALEKHPEWTPLLGGSPKPNGTAKLARR